MNVKHLMDKVLITLEVGEHTALFILISKDGNLHRKGNGNPARTDLPLMMGISHQGHFDALMMTIEESIFNYAGVLRMPNPVGTECRLSIIFQGPHGNDVSFRVVYGDQSDGPPMELAQILINAVKITEPWYEEQIAPAANGRRAVANNVDEPKWWQFWK